MAIYDLIADKLFLQLQKENKANDLTNEFNQLNDDAARVEFADRIWQESNITVDIPMRLTKDPAKSLEFRKQGNQFFSLKNQDYVRALELYNQSICYAEWDSEEMGIGYANRSAIYLAWKKYELCLENIKLAQEHGYPSHLMEKLTKRSADCEKELAKKKKNGHGGGGDDDDDEDDEDDEVILAPKLSYAPHPKVPFIADCLEMRESVEQGRFIVTNRDLSVGKVIAIEDSFCSWTLPSVRYQRCAMCLEECDYNLIPCKQCTSTMFCSKDCADEAHTKFHQYECPIVDFMYKMLNIIQLSAVRVSICALTTFETTDALLQFAQDPASMKINAFTLDYRNDVPKSELYKPIHSLETNQSKRTIADLFQRAVITAVIYRSLIKHSTISDRLPMEEHKKLLMELIFRHLQTASTNFHRLETLANSQDPNNSDDVSYGSGAYGFCSLINHACSPNIVRLPIGTQIAIFVLRPIKAGEELLDNYG